MLFTDKKQYKLICFKDNKSSCDTLLNPPPADLNIECSVTKSLTHSEVVFGFKILT